MLRANALLKFYGSDPSYWPSFLLCLLILTISITLFPDIEVSRRVYCLLTFLCLSLWIYFYSYSFVFGKPYQPIYFRFIFLKFVRTLFILSLFWGFNKIWVTLPHPGQSFFRSSSGVNRINSISSMVSGLV